MDRPAHFSLLCWNIGKSTSDKIEEQLSKADLCLLQEATIGQVGDKGKQQKLRSKLRSKRYEVLYLQESTTATYKSPSTANSPTSSTPGSPAPCNCIIYRTNSFQVYRIRRESGGQVTEVKCALDEVTCAEQAWNNNDWPDEEIQSLKRFAEYDTNKRACVAILQCNNIQNTKIIIASCHIPIKQGPVARHAINMLENLDNISRQGCPQGGNWGILPQGPSLKEAP